MLVDKRKKRGQSLFQSFKPVIKHDNLNSNSKEKVWQKMVRQLQRPEAKGSLGCLFFFPVFSPSMQFHSCDTDQFCISETAGVLLWRAWPSYSYTKHCVELTPLDLLKRLRKKIEQLKSNKRLLNQDHWVVAPFSRSMKRWSADVFPFQHNWSTRRSAALN